MTYDTANGVRWTPRPSDPCARGLAVDPRPLRPLSLAQQDQAAARLALPPNPYAQHLPNLSPPSDQDIQHRINSGAITII